MLRFMSYVYKEERKTSEDPRIQVILDKIYENDPKVSHLKISRKGITDKQLILILEVLNTNSYITSLDLSWNNIGDEGVKALAENTTITKLNLSGNNIGAEGAIALAKNKTIISLDLRSNNIGDEGAAALAQNSTIIDLDLSWNNIGDTGAIELAKNSTITKLNLLSNNIGDTGAIELAKNGTITKLNLLSNNIGDTGAIELAKNSTITKLNLSSNKIGAEGAAAFVQNGTIIDLALSSNNIGDAGAIALAENTTITKLNLSGNKIGDEGAKALARNSTITSLDVFDNYIGDEDRTTLYKKVEANRKRVERITDFVLKVRETKEGHDLKLEKSDYFFLRENTKAVVNYMVEKCSDDIPHKQRMHKDFGSKLDSKEYILKQIGIDILHEGGGFLEATGVSKKGLPIRGSSNTILPVEVADIVTSYLRNTDIKRSVKPSVTTAAYFFLRENTKAVVNYMVEKYSNYISPKQSGSFLEAIGVSKKGLPVLRSSNTIPAVCGTASVESAEEEVTSYRRNTDIKKLLKPLAETATPAPKAAPTTPSILQPKGGNDKQR